MKWVFSILFIFLLPVNAYANFVWPPLFYMYTYTLWWVVVTGLAIEFIVYYLTIEKRFKAAIKLVLTVNIISALGAVAVSYGSQLAFYNEGIMIYVFYTFPLAVYFITVALEYYSAIKILKYQAGKALLKPIAMANILSVGLAIWQTLELSSQAVNS